MLFSIIEGAVANATASASKLRSLRLLLFEILIFRPIELRVALRGVQFIVAPAPLPAFRFRVSGVFGG
jgi:hypothetical protein